MSIKSINILKNSDKFIIEWQAKPTEKPYTEEIYFKDTKKLNELRKENADNKLQFLDSVPDVQKDNFIALLNARAVGRARFTRGSALTLFLAAALIITAPFWMPYVVPSFIVVITSTLIIAAAGTAILGLIFVGAAAWQLIKRILTKNKFVELAAEEAKPENNPQVKSTINEEIKKEDPHDTFAMLAESLGSHVGQAPALQPSINESEDLCDDEADQLLQSRIDEMLNSDEQQDLTKSQLSMTASELANKNKDFSYEMRFVKSVIDSCLGEHGISLDSKPAEQNNRIKENNNNNVKAKHHELTLAEFISSEGNYSNTMKEIGLCVNSIYGALYRAIESQHSTREDITYHQTALQKMHKYGLLDKNYFANLNDPDMNYSFEEKIAVLTEQVGSPAMKAKVKNEISISRKYIANQQTINKTSVDIVDLEKRRLLKSPLANPAQRTALRLVTVMEMLKNYSSSEKPDAATIKNLETICNVFKKYCSVCDIVLNNSELIDSVIVDQLVDHKVKEAYDESSKTNSQQLDQPDYIINFRKLFKDLGLIMDATYSNPVVANSFATDRINKVDGINIHNFQTQLKQFADEVEGCVELTKQDQKKEKLIKIKSGFESLKQQLEELNDDKGAINIQRILRCLEPITQELSPDAFFNIKLVSTS